MHSQQPQKDYCVYHAINDPFFWIFTSEKIHLVNRVGYYMKIFISGNSRSGTTMMSRILGNHENIFPFEELHFFDELLSFTSTESSLSDDRAIKLYATLCAVQRNGYFGSRNHENFINEAAESLKNLPGLSPLQLFDKFLIDESLRNHKTIPCEQTPQTIFSLDTILESYPGDRVIIMVRDPREVLLSQKYKWMRRKFSGGKIPFKESLRARINYHPIIISKIWNSVMRAANRHKNHPSVILIKYEDLIQFPAKTVQRVCDHIGINFSQYMLDIPMAGSSNTGDTHQKRGIDPSRARQWETGGLNSTEIYICQQANETLMAQYNYEKFNSTFSMLLLYWYRISLPFQLFAALLFNIKRIKNLKNILKKKV